MTKEERVKKLKYLITCMKCEVSGKVCDDNCPTQYNAGNTGEIIENLEEIAKALEQEPVLDKIRAEIDLLSDKECCGTTITLYSWEGMKRKVFDIIDKYKAKSEG